MLNPNASAFAYNNPTSPLLNALDRLRNCGVQHKDLNKISPLLEEWYTSPTLNNILEKWETHDREVKETTNKKEKPMSFLVYNVEGLKSRYLEVIEYIHQIEAAFFVCTEIGKPGNQQKIPDYNMFCEVGSNKNGGVAIGVGKHLQAAKIETKMKNTLVVDIYGLNEPLRIIGIYWPNREERQIEEINPFITRNTIISGDFNAGVKEWNSPTTDTRGATVKKWSEENHLKYISCTINSSKRSLRNVDLTFTNFEGISGETLIRGTSDYWPQIYKSDSILSASSNRFSTTNWKIYELFINLVQEFWIRQLDISDSISWYQMYTKFLAALKTRLTDWKDKEKWRPTLPVEILNKLKDLAKTKTRFHKYHLEEDRIALRIKTRNIKKEIWEFRSRKWNLFLTSIQDSHAKSSSLFWKNISHIYKPATTPFNKLAHNNTPLTSKEDISHALGEYYKNLYTSPQIDVKVTNEYNKILLELRNSTNKCCGSKKAD